MDPEFFAAGAGAPDLRHSLGIGAGSAIIVYNGNDHPAVQRDIVSLYMAVDMLIQRGRDVVFVRTGNVLPDYHEGLGFRPGSRCIELGFVKRELIPGLMRLATLAIQPGDADDFNAYRLPAKLPEYLTLGKPIVTGNGNIGPELEAANCATVLPRMTSQAMADAAEWILDHPAEAEAMGARGRAFALKRFSADAVVSGLEAFYLSRLGS
jgi:glycosyltransferase involved in cell wall biosynthesis